MPDKRDRRRAVHYEGEPTSPVCRTTATLPPLVTTEQDDVTCKICRHLLEIAAFAG